MKITIQETLLADDLISTLAPFLIYSEILEGARRPLVFLDVVRDDFSLIGKDGRTIEVPIMTQLSASEDSETNVAAGVSPSDKTISTKTITVTNILYCATQVSDCFVEEYPSLDIMRTNLRNMGAAVLTKLDSNIRDVLAAGYGVYKTTATLDYDAIIEGLSDMEDNSWIVDSTTPPFLLVSPKQCVTLMKDTKFVETPRFYAQSPDRLYGEVGLYAGCRIMKTPALKKTAMQSYALIVFPSNYKFGPSIILAWKRRLRVRTERYETKELEFSITTCRAKSEVVQALGVMRIDITSTP